MQTPFSIKSLHVFFITLALAVFGLSIPGNASLNGTYTINSAGSATSSNYKTLTSAISDITSGTRSDGGTANGSGVSGAVIFKLYDGTYSGQFSLGTISGTSSTKTVTFQSNSGDSSKVVVTYPSSSSSTSNYVLQYNGCQWVTFKQVTLQRSGSSSYGTVVDISGSYNCRITGCRLLGIKGSTSTTYNEQTLVYTYGYADSNNTISGNLMKYGGYGVYHYGYNSGAYATHNKYLNNKIDSVYYTSIYLNYSSGGLVSGNTITNDNRYTNHYGIYFYYCYNEMTVTKNKILLPNGGTGYYAYSISGTSTNPAIVANNFISVGGTVASYGILTYSTNYHNLYYNTVLYTGSNAGSYAVQLQYEYYNNVENNIFANKGSGYAYYYYYTYYNYASDYNDIYSTGSKLANWNGTDYNTLSALQTASSKDANSKSVNPYFVSNTDLHISSAVLNGAATPVTAVKTDIDGQTRNATTPDIGADEFTPPANDAGITSIDSLAIKFCSGTQKMYATISNFGNNTLTKATINWKVNGTTQTAYSWTGSVASGSSSSPINFGSYSFTAGSTYSIVVYTTSPNTATDGNNNNDTTSYSAKLTALNGTYTINASGSGSTNYTSFTNAANDLNTYGVCGAVTFNVKTGSYTDQLKLNVIAGASSRNTITFQSQALDSTKAILTYPSNSSTYTSLIELNGTDWLTIRKMTLQITGTNYYGNVVKYWNGASNNRFISNLIYGVKSTANNGEQCIFNSWYANGNDNDTGNLFKYNYMRNGSYGFYLYGYNSTSGAYEVGTQILNNVIDSSYYAGIFGNYLDGSLIQGNVITSTSAQYGMYYYYCQNDMKFLKNKIYLPNGGDGLYFQYCFGSSTKRQLIANNFITTGGNSSTDSKPIYAYYYNTYQDYYYNNTLCTGLYPGAGANYFYYSYYSNIEDNNFITIGPEYPYYAYGASLISNSDYNNIYTTGSNYVYYDGYYNTLSSFQTGSGKDANSKSVNPFYTSTTDLHVSNPNLNGTATPITQVKDDIDGTTRSLSTPDIGADEFTPPNNDAGISSLDSGSKYFCPGTQKIYVTLTNYGANSLTKATINWKINGTTQTAYSWTGSLASGANTSVNIGNYTYTRGTTYTGVFYTTVPNATTDGNKNNDTTKISGLLTKLNGTYTIGSGGTFSTWTSAASALNNYGVCGAVILNVKDGTYSEQIRLGNIQGVSSSNTVTFQSLSNDSTKAILTYPSDNSSTAALLTLDSTDWITLKKLTFQRTGTNYYSNVIEFRNGASNNKILNNRIMGIKTTSNTTYQCNFYDYSYYNYIADTGNTIQNNYLKYNSYSILMDSYYGYNGYSNKILNNKIDSAYYLGIEIAYQYNTLVNSNVLNVSSNYGAYFYSMYNLQASDNSINNGGPTGSYGMYMQSCSNYMQLNSNKIYVPNGTYGIYLYGCYGLSTKYQDIYNNFISVGGGSNVTYGLYGYSGYYQNYQYNNILNTSSNASSYANYMYYIYYITLENNNIIAKNGGNAYYYNGYSPYSYYTTSDYNNIYSGNSNYINLYGTTYNTLSAFKTGSSTDANSLSIDPQYFSNSDLHIRNTALNGKATPITGITTDIDGQTRNTTTPDIGADEFTPASRDAGIVSIDSISAKICPGSHNMVVTLENYGSTTLTSATINWKVNGTTQTAYSWTGSLASGSTASVNIGNFTYTRGTSYNIITYTTNPNAASDLNNSNDTSKYNGTVNTLNGTYTIGGSSPDFTTFTDAATALNSYGVCGATVFNVRTGTYTEQPSFTAISGVSSSNTVTFQSQALDSTKVILTYPSSGGSSTGLITFSGTDWVTMRKMSFVRTGTSSYATILDISGGSDNNTFKSNIFTGTKSGWYYQYGSLVYSAGSDDTSNTFQNNIMKYGYYGFYWNGASATEKNIRIINNVLDSQSLYSIYIYNSTSPYISGNTITNYNSAGMGMYLYYCYEDMKILKNKISMPNGGYGMYFQYCSGTSTKRQLIYNNFISVSGNSSTDCKPIYAYYYNQYQDFYYNNTLITGGSSGAGGNYFYYSYYSNIENNNFISNGPEYAYYAYGASLISNSDYNNIYTTGSNYVYYDGYYSTLSALQSGSSKDANSLSKDPQYSTTTDLHIGNTGLKGKGTPVTGITDDIDGEARSSTAPSIGADELYPAANDAGITALDSLSSKFCPGSQRVIATLFNYGTKTLTSVTINWKVNGTTQTAYSWTGSIASGSNLDVNIGSYTYSAGTTYKIITYTSNPNGVTDQKFANDTFKYNNTLTTLSGTYTIGSGGSYSSFTTAASAINTNGICGPVIFNVKNGSYTDAITINQVTGASAINTITFQSLSNDSTKATLTYPSSNSSSSPLIYLNGADYVTVRKLTLKRTGSAYYATIFQIDGNAHDNKILSNRIYGTQSGWSSYYGALILSTGSDDSNNVFRYNTLRNGNYGFYYFGGSSEKGTSIQYNNFDSVYYYSIYLYAQNAPFIGNNIINNNNSYGSHLAIYLYSCNNAVQVLKNNIYLPNGGYGIDMQSCYGTSTQMQLYANNFISIGGSSASAGIYCGSSNQYQNWYYNNVLSTNSSSGSYAAYMYDLNYSTIENNNFISKSSSYAYYYPYYYYNLTSDYNNIYTSGSNLLLYRGTAYSSLSSLHSSYSSVDANSISNDPLYVSNSDLHVRNSALNGKATPLTAVTDDYDGQARNATTPDIGADEFNVAVNDAGIASIDSLSRYFCPGTQKVYASIQNYGSGTLTSATINWKVNGTTQTSYSWTGSLTSGGTQSVNIGTFNYSLGTAYTIIAYTSTPNATADGNTTNDTAKIINTVTALSGSYTIGSSGNYSSFTSATTALNTYGVCGAVTFNVKDGTYTEQISINQITGASATNTITFQSQSGDSSKSILTYPSSSSSGSNYALQLNGADYITIKKLTIQRTGSAYYSIPVNYFNGANNNNFLNNRILGIKNSTNSTNDQACINSATDVDTGNSFTNNLIRGGSHGFYLYGYNGGTYETGTKITSNIIDSFYYWGITAYYENNLSATGNKISSRISSAANATGIYMYDCNGSMKLVKNIIYIPSGGNGIWVGYCDGASSNLQLIANNFISVGGTTTSYGIYSTNSNSYENYLYNSVNLTNTNTSSYAGFFYYTYYSNVENNVFSNQGGGYAAYVYAVSVLSTYDYNDEYVKGSNFATWDGTNYASTAAIHSAYSSMETNSKSADPFFTSITDLHAHNVIINGAATPVTSVKDDIDGQIRNTTTPDMGADEFTPPVNDAGISGLDSLAARFCPGKQNVYAILTNYGTASLTSATINWKVNGTTQTAYSWTGTLASGASIDVNLGSFTFTGNTTYKIAVYPTNPNGTTDGYAANDTTTLNNLLTTLNGTYTIGTGGDYTNFTNAVAALNSYGVCGPVTFNVKNGNYVEQIQLNQISGVSAINNVTFQSQSSDSSKVVLSYPSSSGSDWLIRLNGTDWVTFRNMTMQRSGSGNYGTVLDYSNGAHNNKFSNNRFLGTKTGGASYYSSLVFSGSDADSNNIFKNNLFKYGYYGFYLYGYSGSGQERSTHIESNIFDSISYMDIYEIYCDASIISGNVITNNFSGHYGIYPQYCNGSLTINKNKINLSGGGYGIYLYNGAGTSAQPQLIADNFITVYNSGAGIYGSSNSYQNILYNSILGLNTVIPASIYYQSNSSIENNNFISEGSSYAYGLYSLSTVTSDYNNIYSTGSLTGYYNGTTYASLSSFKTATSKDANSISVDPYFVSNSDLHINNPVLNGAATPVTAVKDDIDGDIRNATKPDIGADEYSPKNNDAGVFALDSVSRKFCPGTQPVYVRVVNYGVNTITSLTINWKVNGFTQTAYSWTGSLASGGLTTINIGSFHFTGGNAYKLTFYTSSPNGVTDGNVANDTLHFDNTLTALSGTYTIGGTSPNYNTIGAAVTALNTYGICGPVTFNIRTGVYSEQFSISQIAGANAYTTITFQSEANDSNAVIITWPTQSTSSNNYVMQLNGADWLILKKLTMQRTGSSTYGVVVDIRNNSSNNKFLNNRFKGVKGTTSTGTEQAIIYSGQDQDTANVFKYNNIRYGSYGMYYYNGGSYESGTVISNNSFDSAYYMGLNLYYQTRPSIENNIVTLSSSSYSIGYGINVNYPSYGRIIKNQVDMGNGGYGIYLYGSSASSSDQFLIGNNFITSRGSSTNYGIYSYSNSYLNIYYNNILNTSTNSGSYAGYFYYSSTTTILNNNFVNTGGGYAYGIYPNASGYISNSDYNNYYTSGSNLAVIYGTTRSTLANLQTGTGKDGNSLNVNPNYVSTSDLHVTNTAIDGKATPLVDVTDDIDGDARNSTTPDIGADEFSPPKYDIGVSVINYPNFGFCSGTQNVTVSIKNYGNTPITSAKINWKVNGVTQAVYTWTGASIPKAGTSAPITIGTYSFTTGTIYTVKTYTSLPNSKNDTDKTNDTSTFTGKSGLTGTYTLGGGSANYSTFAASVVDMKARGICGAVTFKVNNGTYSEQISIDSTINTSAAKTVTYTSASNDSTKATLTYPSSNTGSSPNYTLQLNGADYFNFYRIGITRTGTSTYSRVIDFRGGATGNLFIRNRIYGNNSAGTGDEQALIYSGNDVDSANIISNNILKYGSYGICLYSTSTNNTERANTIVGNIIDSASYMGAYMAYQSGMKVSSNSITNIKNTAGYGVYASYCYNQAMRITNNKINLPNGGYGIYQYSYTSAAPTPGVIANNFITIGGTSSSYGIRSYYTDLTDVYYNSVNITNINSSSFAGSFEGYGYGLNINVLNNIFSNTGGGYGMYVPYSGYVSNSDYNDYYSPSGYIVAWNGGAYSTLSSLQAANGTDANSKNVNPYFYSTTDLHVNNSVLNNAATPQSLVTDDIDGQSRSALKPDIGADEFTPAATDAGISTIVFPSASICSGSRNVIVNLGNYGVNTLTKVNINWSVNGTAQTTYSWTGSQVQGTFANNITLGSYTFATGTTYNVKVWTSSPNGTTDGFKGNDTLAINNVNVNAGPTATVGSAQSICNGASTSIGSGSTSGHTYSWVSHPSGFSSTSSNPTVAPTVNTTYVLNETVTSSGCTRADSVAITVKSLPSTPTAGSNSPICAGQTLNLTASTISGATYNWTGPNSFSASSQNPSFTASSTAYSGTYSVSATVSGCTGSAGSTSVTINARPAPSISGNGTVCASTSGSYATSNNSGSSYKWTVSGGSITSGATTNAVAVTWGAAGTGTLKVVEINSNGCKDSTSTSININSLPSANVGSAQSICPGTSTSVGAIAISGHTYSWTSNPSGFTSSSSSATVNPSVTTVYYLTETITASGCSKTDSVKITVKAVPSAPTAGNNGPLCAGKTLNLTASSISGATYSWSGPNSFSSSSQNPSISSVTSSNAGTYNVTATVGGCTSAQGSTVFTLSTTPTPSISGNTAVCASTSSIYATTNVSGNSYKWTISGGTITSGSGTNSVNVTFGASGSATLKVVETNSGGCKDSSAVSISILSKPSAYVGGNSSICNGSSVTLGTTAISGHTYSWTSKPSGLTSTASSITVNPTINTSYYLTETITSGGCNNSDSASITVKTVPAAPTASSNSPICAGQTLNLSASTVSGATYSWSGPGSYTASIQNPSFATSSSGNSGTYSVYATISGCTSTAGVTSATVNARPTPSISGATTTCALNTNVYSTTNNSGSNYKWTISGGVINSGSTTNSVNVTWGSASGSLKVVETNSSICKDSSIITITINPLPSAYAGSSTSICAGGSVSLGTTAVSGNSYSWVSNPSGFTSSSSAVTVSPTITSTYTLTETVTSTGCTKSNNVTITVNPLPTANAGADQTVCGGTSVTIGASSTSGHTYSWSSNPSGFSSSSSNPSTTPSATTIYKIVETITATGCTSSDSTLITVNPLPSATVISSQNLCSGNSINIGTSAVSGHSYSWVSNPSGFSSTNSNPSVSPTVTTTFTLTETNTSTGCKATNSVTITPKAAPSAPTVSNNGPLCSGQTLNLTASSISGATYSWTGPSSFSSTSQNPSIASASAVYSGTFSVTATVGGCTSASASTSVTINSRPVASISGSSSVCALNSQTYTAGSTGNTYKWIVTGGTITSGSGTNSINVNWNTSGSGSVKLVETNGSSCKDSTTTIITINALPNATVSSNQTICSGNSVSLGATSISGHAYSWLSNPSGYTSTSSNPSVSPALTTTYYLIETITATGCFKSDSVVITVKSTPTAPTASNNGPLCTGDNLKLSASTVSGATYTWSGPGSYSSTTQNPSVSSVTTSNSGTYSVTATISGCTSSASSTVVTVNTRPTVSISGNNSICSASSQSYSASSTGNTYKWSVSGGTITSGSGTSTIGVNWGAAGSGSVKLVETNTNGCSDSTVTTITINSLPSASTGSSASICKGSSTVLGSSAISGNTYSWTSKPSGFTSTSSNPVVNPTTNTTYYLTESVTATGCAKADSVVITVNPLPSASVGSATAICSGSSASIGATSVSGNTYSWTSSPAGYTSTASNPTVVPSVTTTYYLTETVTISGCQKMDSVIITVKPNPTAPTVSNNGPLCLSDSLQLSASAVASASYSWTGPNSFSSSARNTGRGHVGLVDSGTYNVTVTVNGCTSGSASTRVIIYARPTASISGNTSVCAGSTGTYSAGSTGNTYTWNISGGTISSGSGTSKISVTWGSTSTGTLKLVETNANGCKDSSSSTITINALPTPSVSGTASVCAGSTGTYSTKNNTGSSYSWSITGGTVSSGSGTNSVVVAWGTAGSGTLKVVETNANGCKDSSSSTITINALPTPSVSGTASVCAGSTSTYSTKNNTGSSYSWNITGGTISSGSGTNSVMVSWGTAGSGTLKVIETNANGCKDSSSSTITINALPTPSVSGTASVCAGSSGNYSTANNTGSSYSWNITGGIISSGSGTNSVMVSWGKAGSGTLKVVETNANGCKDSSTSIITINALPTPALNGKAVVCAASDNIYTVPRTTGSSYKWKLKSGKIISASTAGDSITVAWANATNDTIMLVETNASGCKDSVTKIVIINALPTPKISGPASVCAKSAAQYLTAANTGSLYSWNVTGGNISTGAGTSSIIVNWPLAGTGRVSIMETNANGCFDSAVSIITINAKPIATFTATKACEGIATQFNDISTAHTAQLWYFGDGTTSTVVNPSHKYAKAGTYTASMAILNASGCYDSVSITVIVNAIPNPHWTAVKTSDRTYAFHADDTTLAATAYAWSFGDGLKGSGFKPAHTYPADSTYQARLSITNASGCTSVFDSSIKVNTGITGFNDPGITALTIFPNPFREQLNVDYSLAKAAKVKVIIYAMDGRQVTLLSEQSQAPGQYHFSFTPDDNITQGVYLIRMFVDGQPITKQIIRVK
jgi:hypothetical protein